MSECNSSMTARDMVAKRGKRMRRQGILLPIFSIPSKYGIGTFGKESYEFVDFLKKTGQSLWQILPLGPVGYGASPYQSFSTFAGNPYYIDLPMLIVEGFLTEEECTFFDFGEDEGSVDYEKLYQAKYSILRRAWERAAAMNVEERPDYLTFVRNNESWLEDYALYMALKSAFPGKSFMDWDLDIRLREREAMERYRNEFSWEIRFCRFRQYLFDKQWRALKAYANNAGIEIVGDIPIYVAFDSADTWANPELFQLNDKGEPIGVAGCPPDVFSATGQLWGNPLYNWPYHKETRYTWWIKRLKHSFQLYDVVRIDHFRGFDEYWFVPYGDETAERGHWEKGPGYELFEEVQRTLGDKKVIAEDLGFLTESVFELLRRTGYPGMKILQFAFDSGADNLYLPHQYSKNCVVYTGTHDNETTAGWLKTRQEYEKEYLCEYLFGEKEQADDDTLRIGLIRLALSSVSDTAIIPMQDYLGLGNEARINTPSTVGQNWKWRMDKAALSEDLAERLCQMARTYGRV